ncbi:hypothetical protein Airi02_080820 [Actinoallomurus iriomotensis]|jgi:uncharacterized Zn finger protein|uniref:Uncharacterized protein n=1 Tax=Actinoallomurus iriomotensis TaxID=478107 RepID=A0A9W6SAR4_9ACTN|nr:hypothetical protein Airi02_080820 [Actinoallomurus iriomotensis]
MDHYSDRIGGIPVTECPVCAWPESEPYEVISRHATSEGLVTYSRCACGEVRVSILRYGAAETLRPGS